MKENETKAYNWLNGKGYTNIIFHPNTTPDFTTDQGGFEVKTIINNTTIMFEQGQIEQLRLDENNMVLVFGKPDEPLAIASLQHILTNTIPNIKVAIHKRPHIKTISVSSEVYQRLISYKHPYQTVGGILEELLDIVEHLETAHQIPRPTEVKET